MRSATSRGRVYRRCGCRDHHLHKQLGSRCPQLLADPDHGAWSFAVDIPQGAPGRHTVRRGGFPDRDTAARALRRLTDTAGAGLLADPNQTVADYLAAWLQTKAMTLKPTTTVR